jgi:uncharacterized repeat protein (TIGR01451 family)
MAAIIGLAAMAMTTADGAVIFHDDFETGAFGSHWSISGTRQGRIKFSSDYGPASGEKHLIFDDSVDDGVPSAAEATLNLDLSLKRNVVLTFKARSIGNEPHSPPTQNFSTNRSYDGVALSTNGGATWRTVQSLAAVPAAYQTYSVPLDSIVTALGGTFGSDIRIRFSAFDDAPVPTDGIAFDDVSVTAEEDFQSSVHLPTPLTEGSGPHNGVVSLSFTPETDLTLDIVAAPTGQLVLPATVTVPAGQNSAAFTFNVANDSAVNLTRDVTVRATAPTVTTARPSTVSIYDDEAPIPTLHIPAQMEEAAPSGATFARVTLDRAATQLLRLVIQITPAEQISGNGMTVTFFPGETEARFSFSAWDDSELDGDVPVTVTASAPGLPTATAQTIAVDNELRTISFHLPPTVQEGRTETASVVLGGTVSHPVEVQLANSDPNAATIPASVTVPAGELWATFPIAAHDDAVSGGSRHLTIDGTAATFSSASAVTTIRENEITGYTVAVATDVVNPKLAFRFIVSPADREGNKVLDAWGSVNVDLVLPDGSTQPASPPTLNFAGPDSGGSVTLPPGIPSPLKLRVTDASGRTGESRPFNFLHVLPLTAGDLVWDAARNRIYASIRSTAPAYANQVVAIDPTTSAVVASVTTGNNPGQLALTSGGEWLYVALDANGTIARIDPETLSVSSTFVLGGDTYGPFLAKDMCIVKDQPNLLAVIRRQQGGSSFTPLAVYDNGVARPNTYTVGQVEPSPDANTVIATDSFYGYVTRMRIESNGVAVERSASFGMGGTMVADGNTLVSAFGNHADAAALRHLGSFFPPQTFNIGAVRPDTAVNRVYFVEPSSPSSGSYDKIGAYDSASFALVGHLTMPPVTSAASLIRWGRNGLAFRTDDSVILLEASKIVPDEAPADLSVSVSANPTSAAVGAQVAYRVQVTNQGPNVARNPLVTATLSGGQMLQSVEASSGTPSVSESVITLAPGDLPAGASVVLNVMSASNARGSVSCRAVVSSQSRDANFLNDAAFRLVPIGFQSDLDAVNQIEVTANNLVYDPARDIIWATIPPSVPAPLGRSLIAINPRNGEISDPLSLRGDPLSGCMALAPNGRYLYVGLVGASEIVRVDLDGPQYAPVRIPLANLRFNEAHYPGDLEVLDGDGTSFIVTSRSSRNVAVYDGTVRRPNFITSIDGVDRIERTAVPNRFVGMASDGSGRYLRQFLVSPSGVSVAASGQVSLGGSNIQASGNLVLSNYGELARTDTLTVQHDFSIRGTECLDAFNGRAYLVYAKYVRAFDLATRAPAGNLRLPVDEYYGWATQCIRWGSEGLAIAGRQHVYLARWSGATPPPADQNGDGISDSWALAYFGSTNIDINGDPDLDGTSNAFEYFFATSPLAANGASLSLGVTRSVAGNSLHLIYPRRAEIAPGTFGYERGASLQEWTAATGITESIIGSQMIDGVHVQTIEAVFPPSDAPQGFGRLRWLRP